MDDTQSGQVQTSAAEIYEDFFVPAFFQEWAGPVAAAAAVGPGQEVLDVACGTGVLARELRARTEPGGRVATRRGTACFPSIEAWVHTDVKGWTLADLIDDGQYRRLQAAAGEALADFAGPEGAVRFAHPAHIVTATKP